MKIVKIVNILLEVISLLQMVTIILNSGLLFQEITIIIFLVVNVMN